MSRKLSGLELTSEATAAVQKIHDWVRDPQSHPTPSRKQLAEAVRRSAELLAQDAPGNTVELRVPPFVAVQCVTGPVHRRGNPPNIVQCSALAWLRAAMGVETLEDMAEAQRAGAVQQAQNPGHPASQIAVELSGTRAGEVQRHLPLFGRL